MKSIQTKILCLILIGIIVPSVFVLGISGVSFRKALNEECVSIMTLTAGQNTEELNTVFERVEQSVEILAEFARDNVDSVKRLAEDEDYLLAYTRETKALGETIVNETQGAVAVYVRFNCEYTLPKSGFLMLYNKESGEFDSLEPTDLSLYDKDDIEHVGWYYIPIEEGKSVWMEPYYNKNLDIYMISYVIPVYKDGDLLGVVGMDIDFEYIIKEVDSIRTYETGNAFITNDACEILYSRHHESGVQVSSLGGDLEELNASSLPKDKKLYSYRYRDADCQVMFQKLSNGMYLAVTAPVEEVFRNADDLLGRMVTIVGLSIIGMLCITLVVTRNIVRPLRELNTAAKEIAEGNLDIVLECKTKDEIGTLTESVKSTAKQLQARIDYINNLAYYDKLTGVKNNTAYLSEVYRIREFLENGTAVPAVFVIDVNNLKIANDTYGHEYGNELIITAAKQIIRCFGGENVYRIGGDEFVVLLQDKSYEECMELQRMFEQMESISSKGSMVSAAIGFAIYNPEQDSGYEDVFRNADARMYEKKIRMKYMESGKETDV
ncbi:MAG: diguanylate cyclase [Lachnospiraceae bacterium]|nr:diguanylate cyclase [Lachnospiraceae bacterium]